MSKSLAKILAIIGEDFEEFKKDMDECYAKKVKQMIADTESIADDLRNCKDYSDEEKLQLNIANASIAIRNIAKFDKNDAKKKKKNDVYRLCVAFSNIRKRLDKICYDYYNSLSNIYKEMEDDENDDTAKDKDDLESLSKEELIARLREKSK